MTAPTVTEREAVLRERAAFAAGVEVAHRSNYAEAYGARFNHDGYVDRQAEARYPLPKITRRRVVKDGGACFTVADCGEIVGKRKEDGLWLRVDCFNTTNDRIRLWADLLASPDEVVDEA